MPAIDPLERLLPAPRERGRAPLSRRRMAKSPVTMSGCASSSGRLHVVLKST